MGEAMTETKKQDNTKEKQISKKKQKSFKIIRVSKKCCIKQERDYDKYTCTETYIMMNKTLFSVVRPTSQESKIASMQIKDIDPALASLYPDISDMILQTHLQHFTRSGMSPDECMFILNKHPDYKDIKYDKSVNELWQARDLKKEPNGKDFVLIPTCLPTTNKTLVGEKNSDGEHWVTTVVHFKEDGTNEYHIFDSQQYDDEIFVKSYDFYKDGEEQNELPIYKLSNKDIQGESNLCWLYTLEYMKAANSIGTFKELQTKSLDGTLGAVVKNSIAKKLDHHKIILDELILNNKSDNDKKVISAGGLGKSKDTNEQVESIDLDDNILNKLYKDSNGNSKVLNLLMQVQKEREKVEQQDVSQQETKQNNMSADTVKQQNKGFGLFNP